MKESDMVEVSERCGVFTLTAGKNKLDGAMTRGNRFVMVKVSSSEAGGEDSFMNFANMVR